MKAQLYEAEELYRCYVKRMGKQPPVEVFDEFFWLFQRRDEQALTDGERRKMELIGNYEQSVDKYLKTEPVFDGYDNFLKYMKESCGK